MLSPCHGVLGSLVSICFSKKDFYTHLCSSSVWNAVYKLLKADFTAVNLTRIFDTCEVSVRVLFGVSTDFPGLNFHAFSQYFLTYNRIVPYPRSRPFHFISVPVANYPFIL